MTRPGLCINRQRTPVCVSLKQTRAARSDDYNRKRSREDSPGTPDVSPSLVGSLPKRSTRFTAEAVESLLSIHEAQLLTYLKLGGWKAGLLVNFKVSVLKNGI